MDPVDTCVHAFTLTRGCMQDGRKYTQVGMMGACYHACTYTQVDTCYHACTNTLWLPLHAKYFYAYDGQAHATHTHTRGGGRRRRRRRRRKSAFSTAMPAAVARGLIVTTGGGGSEARGCGPGGGEGYDR